MLTDLRSGDHAPPAAGLWNCAGCRGDVPLGGKIGLEGTSLPAAFG